MAVLGMNMNKSFIAPFFPITQLDEGETETVPF